MANPNLASVTGVYARNAALALASTTETQLITNPAGSGKALLVDGITVANQHPAAVQVSVTMYTSATNTGTGYSLAHDAPIPAYYSLVAVSRDMGVSLLEGQSIYVQSESVNPVSVTASWKELS
jgi:hypothetical protein